MTSDPIGTKDIITFVIASYGAALSTFNLYRSVVNERRRIVIKQSTGWYTYPQSLGPPMACIEIVNRGRRPVVVNLPQLQLPNHKSMTMMNADGGHDFPKRLDDGEAASVRIGYDLIAESLRNFGYSGEIVLRPLCTDSTGKTFRGKQWKFNVDKDWWTKI